MGKAAQDIPPRDPGHHAAYRAVLEFCGDIHGIGPFEAEKIVRLVERAYGDRIQR